jgi:ribosomal protein S18 acetylase RimI-like enzyme
VVGGDQEGPAAAGDGRAGDASPRPPDSCHDDAVSVIVDPSLDQILEFCARDPVERVFLEDVARRGLGRFAAVVDAGGGRLAALCHVGANVVPAGAGCAAFADAAVRGRARMVIGEERAVDELWEAARRRMPRPRADRPGQPVYLIEDPPPAGGTGLRPATADDLDLLVPACAKAHAEELGTDPLRRDAEGFRWRTRAQVEEGRSWIWTRDGVILFKAEASAWTPAAVQLQQVWVDPQARNRGYAKRALRDLVRLLLARAPRVCLFVRTDNDAAIHVYEAIGMRRVLSYRSLIF